MAWSLVLSGGGGNGLAHIGVIKQLEYMGLVPDLIVGTSMGAVIGGVYASGKSTDWIENYMTGEFDIRKMISNHIFRMKSGPVSRVMQAGTGLLTLTRSQGAEKGHIILEELRRATNNISVSQTAIPFACNAVNLLDGREHVFEHENLAEAIRCSMSYMPFFVPYELNGGFYVDGCVADNCPIWIAKSRGFNKILSINVAPLRTIRKEDLRNSFDTVFRAMSVSMQDRPETHKATVNLTVYKGAYNFDFEHQHDLIRLGEKIVKENENKLYKAFVPFYKRKLLKKRSKQ